MKDEGMIKRKTTINDEGMIIKKKRTIKINALPETTSGTG